MQKKNMHDLKKNDLLAIVEEQQKEIDILKEKIDSLEKNLEQKNKIIDEVSLKIDKLYDDAESYLKRIKEAHDEITEYLSTINSADKSDIEENIEDITNEENSKGTPEEEFDDEIIEAVEVDSEINDTKEESQIESVETSNMMLIPIQTSLAIISPIYIKRKKIFMMLVYLLAFLVTIFSLSSCYKVYSQDNATTQLTQNLKSYILDEDFHSNDSNNIINFDELIKINPDTCGWIKVNGIEIDMPVVQTDNNDYYLKYSFDKTYNLSGWAFVDYRDKLDGTDKNIVIYGHNRRDNIMFSPLIKILNEEWYNNEENRYILYVPKDGRKTLYEVFSIYQTEVEEYYMQTDFRNDEEYQTFLNTIKDRSKKKYDVDIGTNDKIITLSTCGNNSKYRVILHAKMVKRHYTKYFQYTKQKLKNTICKQNSRMMKSIKLF